MLKKLLNNYYKMKIVTKNKILRKVVLNLNEKKSMRKKFSSIED